MAQPRHFFSGLTPIQEGTHLANRCCGARPDGSRTVCTPDDSPDYSIEGVIEGNWNTLKISLLAGIFGVAGGLAVWSIASCSGYEFLPIAAGVGAFGTTAFFWWLIVARRNNYSARAGAIAGGLSGLVSHYVCWYLYLIGANTCYWLTGGCVSSLGEAPLDLLNGLWGMLIFSLVSLVFLGWLTVPLGIVVGAWWARRRINRQGMVN